MTDYDGLEQKLQAGIAAARSGDRVTARRLLEEVIAEDDNNELAWIWLASSVTTLSERRACLEKVLSINPKNERAKEALSKLGGGRPATTASTRERDADEYERLRQSQQQARPISRPASVDLGVRPTRRRRLNPAWIVILVLLGIAVIGGSVVGPSLFAPSTPTRPPLIVPTSGPTNTPPPTATPYIVDASTRTVSTLPPTFTPTHTPTETPTFTPSPTLLPPSEYTALYEGRSAGQTNPSLYQIRGDGTDERLLGDDIRDVAYDSTGDVIAFIRDVTYEPDETNPEGTTVSEIFIGPANDPALATQVTDLRIRNAFSPAFSPDGRLIVFVSDWDGDDDLWLLDLQTQVISQLTNNVTQDRDPHWSPDGTTIVYSADQDTPTQFDLYTLTFNTQAGDEGEGQFVIARIRDMAGNNWSPRWSPDGSRIAFLSDRDGDADVHVINASGDNPLVLTLADDNAEDRALDWTPDGLYVGFVSNREDDTFQVYQVDLRADSVVRVTNNNRDILSVRYRPEVRFRVQIGR